MGRGARPTDEMGQVVLSGSLGLDPEASAAGTSALLLLPGARHRHAGGERRSVTTEPHRGHVNKFWLGPFMSPCKQCHEFLVWCSIGRVFEAASRFRVSHY